MAMVATGKLDNEIATCKAACQADGAHGCFRAGAHHAYHFDGWDGGDDPFRQLGLHFGRSAKTGAVAQRLFDCLHDACMRMAEDEGSPGTDVVHVLVAV